MIIPESTVFDQRTMTRLLEQERLVESELPEPVQNSAYSRRQER